MLENNKNSILINLYERFTKEIGEIKNKETISFLHPKSVKNLTNSLIKTYSSDSDVHKDNLIAYFEILHKRRYLFTNKLESINLYSEFLSPIIKYYIKKNEFRVRGAIIKDIFIGIILDVILLLAINKVIIFFSLIFCIIAYLRDVKSKKDGKYAAMFW